MNITAFDHIHIYARDVEHTIGFFEQHLDGERIGAIPNSFDDFNHLVILGGQFIIVSGFPPGMEPASPPENGDGAVRNGYGIAHIGLNVDDLESFIARLDRAGVKTHSAARGSGLIRYVYFTGPDGLVVELTEYRLPDKLAPVETVLRWFNRGVHLSKRALARKLIGALG